MSAPRTTAAYMTVTVLVIVVGCTRAWDEARYVPASAAGTETWLLNDHCENRSAGKRKATRPP